MKELRSHKLHGFPEREADFPPLRQTSVERKRGWSQTRGSSRQRSNSKRSVSRNRQPSRTRERIAWADTLKEPKMPERQPSAENAAIKALRAENEQLKQKIADLEHTNRSINAKLDQLLALQQQPQQPQPAPPQPQLQDQRPAEPVTQGSGPEQDPRAHQRDMEPTPKRRALEAAKDRKNLARLENLEDRFETFVKVTNERLTKLEQTCQNMQTMMMQMQAQLQMLMTHLGLSGDPQQMQPVIQQPVPGQFPQ